MAPALLTGSRYYGLAHKDSDVDLLIRCDNETKQLLIGMSDLGKMPCRFGKLNLIMCTTDKEYEAWKEARNLCYAIRPVTRHLAHSIHNNCRDKYGIEYDHESGEAE